MTEVKDRENNTYAVQKKSEWLLCGKEAIFGQMFQKEKM